MKWTTRISMVLTVKLFVLNHGSDNISSTKYNHSYSRTCKNDDLPLLRGAQYYPCFTESEGRDACPLFAPFHSPVYRYTIPCAWSSSSVFKRSLMQFMQPRLEWADYAFRFPMSINILASNYLIFHTSLLCHSPRRSSVKIVKVIGVSLLRWHVWDW